MILAVQVPTFKGNIYLTGESAFYRDEFNTFILRSLERVCDYGQFVRLIKRMNFSWGVFP